jgi:hypothetical protein
LFCVSECLAFAVTIIRGGSFNWYYHLIRLIMVVTQCAGCLLIAFVRRKIRGNSYAA